jgi:hypothetical protein
MPYYITHMEADPLLPDTLAKGLVYETCGEGNEAQYVAMGNSIEWSTNPLLFVRQNRVDPAICVCGCLLGCTVPCFALCCLPLFSTKDERKSFKLGCCIPLASFGVLCAIAFVIAAFVVLVVVLHKYVYT